MFADDQNKYRDRRGDAFIRAQLNLDGQEIHVQSCPPSEKGPVKLSSNEAKQLANDLWKWAGILSKFEKLTAEKGGHQ